MSQAERRLFLIRELLKEEPRYQRIGVPDDEMHSLAEIEAFSYGFCLGVQLMIEAVVTKEIP